MARFNSLKPGETPNFWTKQNRKDLSWTEGVREKGTEDNSATSTLGGFFNRNEILRECGFDPRDLGDKESWALLEELLEQSCAEFGHERKTAEHPNPLLTKHYFKKGRGKLDTHLEYAKTQMAESMKGNTKSFDKVCLPSSSSGAQAPSIDDCVVKAEFPSLEGAQSKITALKTWKQQLDKKHNEGLDIILELGLKAETDASYGNKVVEVEAAMGMLKTFLDGLRKHIVLGGRLSNMEEKQIKDYADVADGLITNAEIHSDGCKAMVKRMRALL